MEKRRVERCSVEVPVTFSGNGVAGGGMVADLSARGCSLITDEPLSVGTTLTMRIQLLGQYAPLRVELAETRWVNGTACGLEFRRVRLEETTRLQRFLNAVKRPAAGEYKQAG